MANITASMVKELRERTQAGMADCKNALVESGGDMEKAVEVILKKGIVKAAARAGRVAAEGEVATYIAPDGKRGLIVEVNSQTDFVSRGDDFKAFVKAVVAVAVKA
ncbi:MAG: translation elongation factor Ts, partial [Polyangiaceae bacterium]